MSPTLAARAAASVLRESFAAMRQLIELQLPESMERTGSLSALNESRELALRAALDLTNHSPATE